MLESGTCKPAFWRLDADSIRVLYHGLQIPTVLMLVCGISGVWLLRNTAQLGLLRPCK